MTSQAGIPIRVKNASGDGSSFGIGGGLQAIVHEILGMLRQLADSGEGGVINLRSLPISPVEREELMQMLGDGEAAATLDLEDGLSHCRETKIAGVWWIEHQDEGGAIVAEFIEVARVPDILVLETAEIREGVVRLEQHLSRRAGWNKELRDE